MKLLSYALAAALSISTVVAKEDCQTIVEIAAADPRFSTLVAAVKAAGLVGALSGPADLTLFAPPNSAFDKLPDGTVESLLEDTGKLTNILIYHAVAGKVMSKDLTNGDVPTLNGAPVTVDVTDGVKINDATVTEADIEACNGVIHVIDTVLLPPPPTPDPTTPETPSPTDTLSTKSSKSTSPSAKAGKSDSDKKKTSSSAKAGKSSESDTSAPTTNTLSSAKSAKSTSAKAVKKGTGTSAKAAKKGTGTSAKAAKMTTTKTTTTTETSADEPAADEPAADEPDDNDIPDAGAEVEQMQEEQEEVAGFLELVGMLFNTLGGGGRKLNNHLRG